MFHQLPKEHDLLYLGVAISLIGLLIVPRGANAQQGELLDQQLDENRAGYSVIKVWGTDEQMGYAQGFLLADDIVDGLATIKGIAGSGWVLVRSMVKPTIWSADILAEIEGIVAGVKAARPDAELDALDVQAVNSVGDWGYILACRSHSAWGSFVTSPTKTLSSRRLDFSVPSELAAAVSHHVIVARDPVDDDDGKAVRWVNLAWPGFAVTITGVNEYGTLSSLHDYASKVKSGAHMPRCVAARDALTMVGGLDPSEHLDAVYEALQKFTIMTTTFINYYVPEGHGGVITCLDGEVCSKKRVPQPEYFGGEVLITTNDETDGKSAPPGGQLWHDYYAAGKPKTLADHYASLDQGYLGSDPLHRMSVAYRDRGEMTIWASGLVDDVALEPIKLEFAELFDTPRPDAGITDAAPPADAGAADSVGPPDSQPPDLPPGDEAAKPGEPDEGCSCATTTSPSTSPYLLFLIVFLGRRHRSG